MTVFAVTVPADDSDPLPGRRPVSVWSSVLPTMLISAGAGILLGIAWVGLVPTAVGWADQIERGAAEDVVFGLLEILAGLITAVLLMIWPGRRPGAHVAVVLVAVSCASILAWGVGEWLGARALPHAVTLDAIALVVVWPLVTSAATVLRSLVSVLFGPP
jgi:hypothetical protein